MKVRVILKGDRLDPMHSVLVGMTTRTKSSPVLNFSGSESEKLFEPGTSVCLRDAQFRLGRNNEGRGGPPVLVGYLVSEECESDQTRQSLRKH